MELSYLLTMEVFSNNNFFDLEFIIRIKRKCSDRFTVWISLFGFYQEQNCFEVSSYFAVYQIALMFWNVNRKWSSPVNFQDSISIMWNTPDCQCRDVQESIKPNYVFIGFQCPPNWPYLSGYRFFFDTHYMNT